MTDTTWAAKVLEGVPRLHPWHNEDAYIKEADALAAIARMGAGDGLVEQATAALEGVTEGEWGTHHHDNYSEVAAYQPTFNSVCDVHMAADANFIAFTRQWVPEAAAHIVALTAERDDARKEAGIQMRHLKVLADKLAPAEAERDALRATVARLEGALTDMPKAVLRTTVCQGPVWPDDRPGVWLAALEACAKSVQEAVDAAIPAADARAEALKEAAVVAAKFDSDGMYGAAAIHDAILALITEKQP